ncbi:hypothetical protein ACFS07_00635 [Undibacterium arcticum]
MPATAYSKVSISSGVASPHSPGATRITSLRLSTPLPLPLFFLLRVDSQVGGTDAVRGQ